MLKNKNYGCYFSCEQFMNAKPVPKALPLLGEAYLLDLYVKIIILFYFRPVSEVHVQALERRIMQTMDMIVMKKKRLILPYIFEYMYILMTVSTIS